MKEPQIGIEPMTARQENSVSDAAPLWTENAGTRVRSQAGTETAPNRAGSGNEVATGGGTWTRLHTGQTRHEFVVQQLVSHGWRCDGLREEVERRALAELATCPTDLAPDDPAFELRETEWGIVLERLCRRIPDAWRIVREGPEEGWGYPVDVLELAEVVVTSRLTEAKQVDYAMLWLTGDSCETLAVRFRGFDPNGSEFPLMGNAPDYHHLATGVGGLCWY